MTLRLQHRRIDQSVILTVPPSGVDKFLFAAELGSRTVGMVKVEMVDR